MTGFASRRVLALGLLTLVAFGASLAGELFRPVPPDAQVTRFTRFNIRYSLRDVVADGVQKVEFYITEDMGRTWRLYGEDPDRTSPMTIQVPGEGVYGFVCIATDRFGNREREPGPRSRPETVIVVDRTPPQAKWIEPLQDVLTKTGQIEFKWETSDPYLGPAPVVIQYAHNAQSNHDRDANWEVLQEKLAASGSYVWNPPAELAGKFNFRLIVEDRAGNITVAFNPATMAIDTEHPRVVSVSPLKSNKLDIDFIVDADDGPNGSGVRDITIYTSDNNGLRWDLLKETNENNESVPLLRQPGQPIPFRAPQPGDYAVWPVVFDMADNASPIPPRGIPGPYILSIDTEPPSVTLSNSFLQGRGAILANETRIVEWTSYDPHPREGTGVVYLSLDNGHNWQEIRAGLSSTGSAVVNFPFGSQSEEAMLKVTVADDFGNVGESVSQVFKLSAADTVITGVAPVDQGSIYAPPPSGASSFGYPGDDYGTQPPAIPPPPQTSFPSAFPGGTTSDPFQTSPGVSDPYGTTYTPSTDPFATYPTTSPTLTDPYATTYTPPTASDPYAALYGSTTPGTTLDPYSSSTYVPGQQESMAGSFPSAMVGGSQPSGAASPFPSGAATAPSTTYTPAPAASEPPALQTWNPTPRAVDGTDTAVFSPPPASADAPALPPMTLPDSGDDFGSSTYTPPAIPAPPPTEQPSLSGSQTPDSTPILPPPPATGIPATPSGDDPFSSLLGDTGSPAPATQPGGFDIFGSGGLTPPPLPGESAPSTSAPTPATSSGPPALPAFDFASPPPAATEAPALPGFAAAPAATPSAAPAPSVFDSAPAEVAPIPGFDSAGLDDTLRPPPMAPASGAALPSDPRQLSNHYAEEAKNYLDEGRIDLALEAANRALASDNTNPLAHSRLAQAYVQQDPPDFARAATQAKEATNIGRDWYSWWTCSDVFFRWAHARNRMVQTQLRSGQRPSPDLLDERNQALNNAQISIGNAAKLVQNGSEAEREQVAMTQGEISYLRALSIPEPIRPPANAPAATQDEYRRSLATYKASVTPLFQEALPYFQTALQLGGSPSYRETFHMGIINFRLGGLEKDTGNAQQAARHYEQAAQYLEEATIATQVPAEGPREAYYMLAYCHDQLAEQPGRDRARHKEMALRYWRRTIEFYAPGSSYRDFAEQRVIALQHEMGL